MKADYAKMDKELRAKLHGKNYLMGNLANASAIIRNNMEDVNWVGFYLLNKDEMLLGPFQGDPARTRIPLFRGVIGKAMKYYKTQVVNDFECGTCKEDCASKIASQIAVPIFYNREPVGVLSIDSELKDRFDEEDVCQLQHMAKLIQKIWRHMY